MKKPPAAKAKRARRARPGRARPAPRSRARRRTPRSPWLAYVAKHRIVLASARGPVPNIAEAVAGEPIFGSWWAHRKGKAIFAALSVLDDSDDVRCFKLIGGKITLAHRRAWPAIARLADAGVLAADQVAALQQEHMPTGEHRNLVTPYPEWVDDATAAAAGALSVDAARAQMPWLEAGKVRSRKRQRQRQR
jgi:hypothetical protein